MSVPFPVSRSIPENDEPENVPLPPETPGETRFPDAAEVLDEAKARVESGGPNELRESLGKLISLCQHLTSRISTLEPQLSELQTTLTLTQSNLTLAMANTEMLEDALKNTNARDVGWRRSDSTSRRPVAFSVSYPSTSDAKVVVHAPSPLSPSSSPPATLKRTTSTASTPNESRFFKFRFGSKSPSPTSPAHPASPPPAHLTSASLPSLGLALEEAEKEEAEKKLKAREEELSAQIKARDEQLKAREEALKAREAELAAAKAKEKELNELLASEKRETARVSEEIESLTQSLFEEANKMVADERKKMAEVEALLRETEEERDAVRGAMKVVEGENGRLRELSAKLEVEGRKSEESWKEEESWKVVEADTSKSEVAVEDSSKAGSRDEPVKDELVKEVESAKSVDPAEEGPTVSVEEPGKSDEPDEPLDTPARSPSPSSPALSREGTPEPQLNGYRAIPSLPNSSSDIWKDQARDRGTTPPKTPPRVHTLPVETSPWAEGKA